MSEPCEVTSCEKILEFRCGCRDTTHDFVAADAGEDDAVPWEIMHAANCLAASFGRPPEPGVAAKRSLSNSNLNDS